MRDPYSSSPCVVVGVDGSRSAVQAALWAVDEAVDQDVPLRFVCAIDSSDDHPDDAAAELADAEKAIRDTFTAVELTGKPVTMEAEIVRCRPIAALLETSRSAAMICVGATGLKHAVQGRTGSTASALAGSAHCPVAIVPTSAGPTPRRSSWILAVVDESPAGNAVLELAVSEAQLRGAPLRAVNTRPIQHTDVHDAGGAAAANDAAVAQFDRRLAPWQRNHPNLDIFSTVTRGGVVNYLAHLHRNAEPVQLLVVDPRRLGPTDALFGPAGRAALDAARCTVLICDRQCWL